MWEGLQVWLEQNEAVVVWSVAISAATFVGSLVAVPIVVIRMPSDYFLRNSRAEMPRTLWQLVRRALKNLLGGVLLVMGLAMLVLPGQGLLTMLLGISLIDFPGKRSLQLRLLRFRGVRRSVDWMRLRSRKPPLQMPEGERL